MAYRGRKHASFPPKDSFLEAFRDTDDTVHTDCHCLARRHGEQNYRNALFRIVREFRVQKKQKQVLKKQSLNKRAARMSRSSLSVTWSPAVALNHHIGTYFSLQPFTELVFGDIQIILSL